MCLYVYDAIVHLITLCASLLLLLLREELRTLAIKAVMLTDYRLDVYIGIHNNNSVTTNRPCQTLQLATVELWPKAKGCHMPSWIIWFINDVYGERDRERSSMASCYDGFHPY